MSKIKIYKASAGSGKTYTLALEYIKELLIAPNNQNYRHILAVTFTKDATGEMKDRILAELYGLAFHTNDSEGFYQSLIEKEEIQSKNWTEQQIREKSRTILENILHDYGRLNITTIDSFFQKVLRNLARELGKGSKYNLEMNTNKVLKEAVHSTIEKANKNKQILEWLTTYIEHKLDEDKNWRIEDEIFEFSKCIYNEFFQEHEQSLRKQIQENPKIFFQIKKEQEDIQKKCRDFFVSTYQNINQLLQENSLLPEDFIRKGIPIKFFQKLSDGEYSVDINKTLQDCCDDASCWTTKTHEKKQTIIALAENKLIPALLECLKTYKIILTSRMITGNLHQLGLVWDITKEISEQNAENNRFMLSDTAMFLNQMIDKSDAPFIYEKLGSQIHHVMIDEFQDTSRLQWSNFKVLLSNIIDDDKFSLIVGDVKQSIYRWRNGDWRILSNIGNELNAQIETLQFNYRSEENIIEFNNSFFVHSSKLLDNYYNETLDNLSKSPFDFAYKKEEVEQKPKKKIKKGFVSVEFIAADESENLSYSDKMKEAVFHRIKTFYEEKIPAGNICILTRTNKDIIRLADYLSSLKDEYPNLAENNYLNIISSEAFQFQSSPSIKIIIETLKVISDSENNVSREQLDYFLRVFDLDYPKYFETSFIELSRMPLFELIGYLYRAFQLDKIEGQSAYIFSFYDAVSKYLNEKPADINHFLQYWNDELKTKTIPTGSSISGIQAMTIHKSKGLQFHSVIIPYCDWNINPKAGTMVWTGKKEDFSAIELLPISYSSKMNETIFSPEYKDETVQSWMDNLNILYVGFTRAEHNLIILSKYKKPSKTFKISSISDILQSIVKNISGDWDEESNTFRFGEIDNSFSLKEKSSDNPLKQELETWEVFFSSQEFKPGKSIFKQSNKSREFVNPDKSSKEQYVSYGNIMHAILEQVAHWNLIETSVENFVLQGLILPEKKSFFVEKIRNAIQDSNVIHWFDDTYKNYRECSIIREENGEIVTKRPDKVLVSEKETIVVDYKFGKAHNSHRKQVQEYMNLLSSMNYSNIKGYLWYVEENRVEGIENGELKVES